MENSIPVSFVPDSTAGDEDEEDDDDDGNDVAEDDVKVDTVLFVLVDFQYKLR